MIWDIIIIGFKFLERRLFFGPSLYIWNPENLLEMVLFTHKNIMSIIFFINIYKRKGKSIIGINVSSYDCKTGGK